MDTFYLDQTKYSGRPADSDRTPQELASYDLLDSLSISYARVDHSHADTIEACHQVEQVLGQAICKNLFLCNRQKTQFYLLLMEGDKVFKTKYLSKALGVARLSFAEAEDLQELLGLVPGSVTVLGLRNDKENRVQLVVDKPVWEAGAIGCHPCISTSTVAFSMADLREKLLPALHHEAVIVELPEEEND